MTAPAIPAATTESSPSTFASDIGEFFGDYVREDEQGSEHSTSAAGTTPAEPATEPATEPAAATGDQAPPASDGTTPAAETSPKPDDDPFSDTTALTYTVNGEQRAFDDIRVFKEGGAVIRPEALEKIANRLGERDSLFERNRAQSLEYQTLAKVTEWHDPTANKTYTGPDAAIEMRIGNAALFAENQLIVSALKDPEKLFALLTTEPVPDGKGGVRERVILNPSALRELQRESALQQREIANAVRDHYKTILADAAKPAPAPIDFEAAAPQLIKAVAEQAKLDAASLTPADVKLLAEQLPFHVKDGQASLAWQNLAKQLMQDRAAHKASSQALVSTTVAATKDAQARMAAAARGMRQPVRPTTPQAPPSRQQEKASDEGALFDSMLNAGSRAMRSRA